MKTQRKTKKEAIYSLPQSEDELRTALSNLFSNNAIALINNKIPKNILARKLGFPLTTAFNNPPEKWKWIFPVLSEFENFLLSQEKVNTESKKSELKQRLTELYDTNTLPLYRGKIARNPLQKLLDFPPMSLLPHNTFDKWKWARVTIDEFDDYLRNEKGHGTVWEEKVPVIKKKLEKLQKSNELPINALGWLNRSAILKQFGLGSNCSASLMQSRAPLLKKLFDEFDKQISQDHSIPYKYAHLEEKLKKILERPDLKLTHDRIVSVKWVCKQLGVKHHNIIAATPPLKTLLNKKQREIDIKCRRGTTKKSFNIGGVPHLNVGATPYSKIHQRTFSFEIFVTNFGLEFVEKLGTSFLLVVGDQKSPKQYYNRLTHFLNWLIKNKTIFANIVDMLSNNKRPKKMEFERAVLSYIQDVQAEMRRKTSGSATQGKRADYTIIKKLSIKGIFPEISYPKTKSRRNNKDIDARQSLVEAEIIDKETGKILKIVEDAALYRDIDFSVNKDTKAFAITLAKERIRREDLPDSLPEAIGALCDERLDELKKNATSTINDWRKMYSEGKELIKSATYSPIEISELLEKAKCNNSKHAWSIAISSIFPKHDRDTALCNLLSLIEYKFSSICPTSRNHEWGQTWSKTYNKVGGIDFAQKYLAPTQLATSAAVCLYLCESGANVAVGLTMKADALRPSNLRKHMNIVSNKARSAGKPIYYDLPVETGTDNQISAVKALTLIRDASSPLRSSISAPHSNKLALYASQGLAKVLKEWQLRDDVKAMSNMSELLSGYRIVPSMIRPTVLLSAQLKNPTNLGIAQQLAQHESESTTMGYVRKLPYRLILEERIRRFADTVQLVIANKLTNADTKLGINTKQWSELSKSAQKTGLGLFCSNPLDGAQSDYPKGNPCKAIDQCLTCDKMIVVAEPTSISDMIIWNESLSNAENKWLEDRYTRWENIWVPWQAFFHVILNEKMVRGELAAIKKEASFIAEKRKAQPNFKLPEPW